MMQEQSHPNIRIGRAGPAHWPVSRLMAVAMACALALGAVATAGLRPLPMVVAVAGVAGFAAHLVWQMRRLDIDDPDRCYAAVRSRDERFDGRFVVGVTSTGICGRRRWRFRGPYQADTGRASELRGDGATGACRLPRRRPPRG